MNTIKYKKHISAVIQYIMVAMFIVSGILKMVKVSFYQDLLQDLHPVYQEYMVLLGVITFLIGVLLSFRRTFIYGFIIGLVFFGGTIAAHLQHGDIFVIQVIFVILLSVVSYLKYPSLFKN
ncbi:hypothetical protein [Kordia sp.]|uniref:hypothetical protein n=1 Tax=Kordia sp. TaxID=1965332 RepID=UPI003B5AE573